MDFLHKHGAKIHLETRVSHLNHHIDGRIEINGELFDAVILAVAPYHVDALLPEDTPDYIQTAYQSLSYHAITTVYLRYAQAVKLPAPLTGFSDGTAQWVLHRGALGLPDNEVVVVISVSDCIEAWKDKDLAEKIHADIKRVYPDLGKPETVRIITEKTRDYGGNGLILYNQISHGCTIAVFIRPATTSIRVIRQHWRLLFSQALPRLKSLCWICGLNKLRSSECSDGLFDLQNLPSRYNIRNHKVQGKS